MGREKNTQAWQDVHSVASGRSSGPTREPGAGSVPVIEIRVDPVTIAAYRSWSGRSESVLAELWRTAEQDLPAPGRPQQRGHGLAPGSSAPPRARYSND
jgi:hypothetical protein